VQCRELPFRDWDIHSIALWPWISISNCKMSWNTFHSFSKHKQKRVFLVFSPTGNFLTKKKWNNNKNFCGFFGTKWICGANFFFVLRNYFCLRLLLLNKGSEVLQTRNMYLFLNLKLDHNFLSINIICH